MLTRTELLDYLRNRSAPTCTVTLFPLNHLHVACGRCEVIFAGDADLTTTTANEIERMLEPCLGPHWMP